jgi:hypothetical protein
MAIVSAVVAVRTVLTSLLLLVFLTFLVFDCSCCCFWPCCCWFPCYFGVSDVTGVPTVANFSAVTRYLLLIMAILLLAFPDVSVVSCIAVYPTVGGVLTAVDIFGVLAAARFFAVAITLAGNVLFWLPSGCFRPCCFVGEHVSCCWRSCCCWRTFFC